MIKIPLFKIHWDVKGLFNIKSSSFLKDYYQIKVTSKFLSIINMTFNKRQHTTSFYSLYGL